MKKTPLLFLLCLSVSLLTACGNDPRSRISFKEVTKEEFDAYFTAEKVSAAKKGFESIKSFYMLCNQTTEDMNYHLERYIDTNYYYEYANYVEGETRRQSHILYICDSNPDNSKRYAIDADGTQDVTSGETVINAFNEDVELDRGTITNIMEDNLRLLKECLESPVPTYYVGSNNIIRVEAKDSKTESKGYVDFDKESLLIYSAHIDINSEYGNGTIEYSYSYHSFEHKSPQDIGFKQ